MVEAFPFLIAKSAGTPRRPVVLPDFLKGEEAARLLGAVAEPGSYEKEGAVYSMRDLTHSKLGPFHAVYQHRKATAEDLGREPDKLFPEHITEGFLVRGDHAGVVGFGGPASNVGTPEERPWSFFTHGPPGAPKDFEYSKKHMDAASEAMRPKLREFAQAKEWTEASALSDVKLDLATDTGPKLNITSLHSDKHTAEQYYAQIRGKWEDEAAKAARGASATAEKATASAGSWSERLGRSWERHLLNPNPKRELGFAAAAVVTLGAALAWHHWWAKHQEPEQARSR